MDALARKQMMGLLCDTSVTNNPVKILPVFPFRFSVRTQIKE